MIAAVDSHRSACQSRLSPIPRSQCTGSALQASYRSRITKKIESPRTIPRAIQSLTRIPMRLASRSSRELILNSSSSRSRLRRESALLGGSFAYPLRGMRPRTDFRCEFYQYPLSLSNCRRWRNDVLHVLYELYERICRLRQEYGR